MSQTIWARSALLPGGWAESVAVCIDDHGDITEVSPGAAFRNGERVSVLIPGIPNVHSHAHQRAMSGLGERAGDNQKTADSFWTWRKVMYHYLERIQPEHLFDIAAQLYVEMLKSGYTCVGEFQYLHHDMTGQPYADRAEMSLRCMQAAKEVGLGFTALPVLYRYGGFDSADPIPGQKRFLNDREGFIRIVQTLQTESISDANTSVGIAPHSLRAIDQQLLSEVIESLGVSNLAAIHIHVAEQSKEVDDCLSWSGQRPVEWLLNHFDLDHNWCLIHATHITEAETVSMAKSGCIAGLCPSTEANLGDGFFNAIDYVHASGRWAIGSDSHISISPVEELRWLEYGQRLIARRRNLLLSRQQFNAGRSLFDAALDGGAQACGRKIGRIETGYRADLLVLDDRHPRLYGRKENDLLDSWIFSGNDNLVNDVYVGGRKVISDGVHSMQEPVADRYRRVLDKLSE